MSGSYTFDAGVPDDDPAVEDGHYNQTGTGASGFNLSVNQHTIQSNLANSGFMYEIHVHNSISDHYHVGSWGNTPLANGVPVDDIMLDLYDDSGSALNSTELSTTAPNVSAFMYKDLMISGYDPVSSQYYNVLAKINVLQSDSGPSNPDLVTFEVTASIKDVWDPANALSGTVQVGDPLDGSYTFNITTADTDPVPEIGRYVHVPGSGQFGFDFTAGGHSFKTNPNAVEMAIDLYDNTWAPEDNYDAYSYGPNFPLASGATVEDIGVHLYDPNGTMLSSDALSSVPPPIASTGYHEVYIWGMHPNGMDSYTVIAEIHSITVKAGEEPELVAIFPGSGMLDRAQRFDMGIIFQPGLAPMIDMAVNNNGFDETPSLSRCFPGAPNNQNRQTFVCPDFQDILIPGMNTLDFRFMLQDGTEVRKTIEWETIGF
jgi:hypothetical protein